jgi:hypothetical protein
MLAVTMTAVVPRDDSITGGSDEGSENVERSCKVRSTMNQKERWV